LVKADDLIAVYRKEERKEGERETVKDGRWQEKGLCMILSYKWHKLIYIKIEDGCFDNCKPNSGVYFYRPD